MGEFLQRFRVAFTTFITTDHHWWGWHGVTVQWTVFILQRQIVKNSRHWVIYKNLRRRHQQDIIELGYSDFLTIFVILMMMRPMMVMMLVSMMMMPRVRMIMMKISLQTEWQWCQMVLTWGRGWSTALSDTPSTPQCSVPSTTPTFGGCSICSHSTVKCTIHYSSSTFGVPSTTSTFGVPSTTLLLLLVVLELCPTWSV